MLRHEIRSSANWPVESRSLRVTIGATYVDRAKAPAGAHLLFTGRTHLIFGAPVACCLPDKRTCLAGGWDDLSAYGVSIRWQTGRIASVMGADYNSYR